MRYESAEHHSEHGKGGVFEEVLCFLEFFEIECVDKVVLSAQAESLDLVSLAFEFHQLSADKGVAHSGVVVCEISDAHGGGAKGLMWMVA